MYPQLITTLSSPAFDTRRVFCAERGFAPRVICPREADCYDFVRLGTYFLFVLRSSIRSFIFRWLVAT